jgi:hypothetical protein
MVEPVSSEDISNHPWLSAWNKIDESGKIDILRAKVTELEDLLGTASIILIILVSILLFIAIVFFLNMFGSGSISMSQVGQISGMIKQFTGR